MSIKYTDILKHNNPLFPIVDIEDTKGGIRTIQNFNNTDLFNAFSPIPEKFKQNYTKLIVTSTNKHYYLSGEDPTITLSWTLIGLSGEGSLNSLAKWTSNSSLTASIISEENNVITIDGDLIVLGTSSVITSQNLLISDPIILLTGSQSGAPIYDSGLFINRGTSDTQAFIWDESADEFSFLSTPSTFPIFGNVEVGTYSSVRTGRLIVGTANEENSRLIVSSTSGTVSLVVDNLGNVYNKDKNNISNLSFGLSALLSNNLGINSTAFGTLALYNNNANNNTAIGYSTLYSNMTGINNTAIGSHALYNSTGSRNIGIGNYSGSAVSGDDNIIIASDSTLLNSGLTLGNNNTIIGNSVTGVTTGSNNTIIGKVSNLSNNLNNSLVIADGVGNIRIFSDNTGNIGIGLTGPTNKLHIFATQSNAFRLQDGSQGLGYVLISDANGVGSWTASAVTAQFSGTQNFIPKFTNANSLGNSRITDNGTNLNIGSVPQYANNSTALAAGLIPGDVYQTFSNVLMLVRV